MPWILPRSITNKCITSMLEKHIKCKLCFGLDKTIRYVKDQYYPSGNPAISQFHDAPSRIITSISWCCAMIMVYRHNTYSKTTVITVLSPNVCAIPQWLFMSPLVCHVYRTSRRCCQTTTDEPGDRITLSVRCSIKLIKRGIFIQRYWVRPWYIKK